MNGHPDCNEIRWTGIEKQKSEITPMRGPSGSLPELDLPSDAFRFFHEPGGKYPTALLPFPFSSAGCRYANTIVLFPYTITLSSTCQEIAWAKTLRSTWRPATFKSSSV